jgi:dihydrodipicolinate synthase/N-acetylneuraminate lyase
MVKQVKDKMKRLTMKLYKAWTEGKEKKAIKLQHKILKRSLKEKG